MTNREISRKLGSRAERTVSPAAGAKPSEGSRKAPGISAGGAGSLQQDMEHDVIPLSSCPQSIGAECCDGAGGCLWW
ncbi:MAG TPA: hypothetical protein VNU23_05350 [Candidatus Cybelea sp.]|nr:hypothetical protein [Candidatus Cybelea sp.]